MLPTSRTPASAARVPLQVPRGRDEARPDDVSVGRRQLELEANDDEWGLLPRARLQRRRPRELERDRALVLRVRLRVGRHDHGEAVDRTERLPSCATCGTLTGPRLTNRLYFAVAVRESVAAAAALVCSMSSLTSHWMPAMPLTDGFFGSCHAGPTTAGSRTRGSRPGWRARAPATARTSSAG